MSSPSMIILAVDRRGIRHPGGPGALAIHRFGEINRRCHRHAAVRHPGVPHFVVVEAAARAVSWAVRSSSAVARAAAKARERRQILKFVEQQKSLKKQIDPDLQMNQEGSDHSTTAELRTEEIVNLTTAARAQGGSPRGRLLRNSRPRAVRYQAQGGEPETAGHEGARKARNRCRPREATTPAA